MSGRFAGRTKDSCFKAFMTCDDEILDALATLGNIIDLPAGACSQLERVVCILYRSIIYTKVNELCWFLYSNRAAEGEHLPPTSGSLDLHIRRAHYISMIWRKSCENYPFQHQQHLVGHLMQVQVTSFQFVVQIHQLLKQY